MQKVMKLDVKTEGAVHQKYMKNNPTTIQNSSRIRKSDATLMQQLSNMDSQLAPKSIKAIDSKLN